MAHPGRSLVTWLRKKTWRPRHWLIRKLAMGESIVYRVGFIGTATYVRDARYGDGLVHSCAFIGHGLNGPASEDQLPTTGPWARLPIVVKAADPFDASLAWGQHGEPAWPRSEA